MHQVRRLKRLAEKFLSPLRADSFLRRGRREAYWSQRMSRSFVFEYGG